MKTLAALLLVCASLWVTRAEAITVTILDPYLIQPNNLQNLQLETFLKANPTLANYAAAKVAGDGVAAGIVLVETNVNAPVTISDITGLVGLRPYSDKFLTAPPGTASPSLTISNLWHINGKYYAAALTGVLQSAGGHSSDELSASQQNEGIADATITFALPPVVLVHGLWGNKDSLDGIANYLAAQSYNWSAPPTQICYSLYLRFNATTDPLTDGQDPCEYTSADALGKAITSTFATLDSERIVSGRVDIVAHSMGGLVLRNYAAGAGYSSPRNGMLGQFHTIVTIDTPELGSDLAPFLIDHRTDSLMAPFFTDAGLFWNAVCGSNDVELCFAGLGDPLSATTLPVTSGAVYSLEPAYVAAAKISGPAIPNTSWFAVSAIAPGNGALAKGINLLIEGLYKNPSASNVPTVYSILQSLPDDSIVTVPSQLNGAIAGQSTTLQKLSHTVVPSELIDALDILYLEPLDSSNVLDSAAVDSPLTCWLVFQNKTTCLPAQSRQISQTNTDNDEQATPARILTHDVSLGVPGKTQLALPVDIAVHFPAQLSVARLAVFQKGDTGESRPQTIRALSSSGGALHISVVPEFLGPVGVHIAMRFSDGSVSFPSATMFVVPPTANPSVFKAHMLPYLELDLSNGTKVSQPEPYAIYPGLDRRVWLTYPFVTYRLVSHAAKPVIDIKPNGLIHALAPGDAEIEARFGALTDRVHVIVRAAQR
jgi:pimeloyl-ACP methyl ester carboxylesterase